MKAAVRLEPGTLIKLVQQGFIDVLFQTAFFGHRWRCNQIDKFENMLNFADFCLDSLRQFEVGNAVQQNTLQFVDRSIIRVGVIRLLQFLQGQVERFEAFWCRPAGNGDVLLCLILMTI